MIEDVNFESEEDDEEEGDTQVIIQDNISSKN